MNLARNPQSVTSNPQSVTPCATDTVIKIRQLSIALRAAQFRSRPPIIASISELPLSKARDIYREVTGCDPIKGQLPSDTTFYISDATCHLESIWLVQTYRMLSNKGDSHADQCECMFMTYEMYLKIFVEPAISFDRFFILLRHTFFGNEILLRTCRDCSSVNISVKRWDPNKVVRCPICHLSAQMV